MDQRERGISPAESTPQERRGRLLYSEIRKERDRLLEENGLEIAHQITSTFIIDQGGKARIFRELRGELVIHSFDSLPQALDQIERVIQHKLGFQKRIGKVFLDIYGENEDLAKIGSMLLFGADNYYEILPEAREGYAKSLAITARNELKGKRNVHKAAAAEVLRVILESDDEFRDDAAELIKAGKDAFDAAISGVRIVSGETVRLIGGQYWFEHWGKQSLKIYERLAYYYDQLKVLNEKAKEGKRIEERKKLAQEIAGKFKEGGSFWEAIGEIKANPFFKRFDSPQIKGLRELPWALSTSRFKKAEKDLAKAIVKLGALERDFERGRIRLLQPKSTSKPLSKDKKEN